MCLTFVLCTLNKYIHVLVKVKLSNGRSDPSDASGEPGRSWKNTPVDPFCDHCRNQICAALVSFLKTKAFPKGVDTETK